MPVVEVFRADRFRCFSNKEWLLSPEMNVLVGPNGSGKTSFTEAIYVLLRGKSFLVGQNAFVALQHERCVLSASMRLDRGLKSSIGVETSKKGSKRTVRDGRHVRGHQEIAAQNPLIMMNQQLLTFFEGGPERRRKFVDQGMFHVEHHAPTVYAQYQRLLQQRNHLLKQNAPNAELAPWTQALAAQGLALHALRERFLKIVLPLWEACLLEHAPQHAGCWAVLQPGWDERLSLQEALAVSLPQDRKTGWTHQGPHRADLCVLRDATPVAQHLSRGQQKLLVLLLHFALGEAQKQQQCPPIYLLDDLFVEFDGERQEVLRHLLANTQGQRIITAHEPQLAPEGAHFQPL